MSTTMAMGGERGGVGTKPQLHPDLWRNTLFYYTVLCNKGLRSLNSELGYNPKHTSEEDKIRGAGAQLGVE